MKRYITYGYMALALFFVLVLHKGINGMPYFSRYISHVWSGAAPYYGIEVEYITPEELERRKVRLTILSGIAKPNEKEKVEPLELEEPELNLPVHPIEVFLPVNPKVQPDEVVNASAAAGFSENHLHD